MGKLVNRRTAGRMDPCLSDNAPGQSLVYHGSDLSSPANSCGQCAAALKTIQKFSVPGISIS